jgi:hypothetical protein
MQKTIFATVLGFAALGAVGTASTAVSAAPILPFAMSSSHAEEVRYVCQALDCWRRPNYYRRYGYYPYPYDYDRPRYYRRPYGYYGDPGYRGGYRGWHRGWHRGWEDDDD